MEAIISTEAGGGGGHQGEVGVDQDEGAARPPAAALPHLPTATLETTRFCWAELPWPGAWLGRDSAHSLDDDAGQRHGYRTKNNDVIFLI